MAGQYSLINDVVISEKENQAQICSTGSFGAWYTWLLGLYICCLCVVSVQLNSVLLATLFRGARSKRWESATCIFMMAMVGNDLCVSLFGHTMDLTSFMSSGWQWGTQVNHLLSVKRLPSTERTSRRWLYILIVIVCLVYSAMWAAVPLYGNNSYIVGKEGITCSINFPGRESTDLLLSLCILLASWLIPMYISYYCYKKVFTTVVENEIHLSISDTKDIRVKRILDEKDPATISMRIFLGQMVAWSPYASISLASLFVKSARIPTMVLLISKVLAKTCVILNPLIYMNGNPGLMESGKQVYPWFTPYNWSKDTEKEE